MAQRPIFIPRLDGDQLFREISVSFTWHPGMAPSQKQKNVAELHEAAANRGFSPLLEVSTKSKEKLGQKLSAFNLDVRFSDLVIAFESAYQGSKVFQNGGPFRDLYDLAPREAKRDLRLQTSGPLVAFDFYGTRFPLIPKTAFYDWLYLHAVYPDRDALWEEMSCYAGFTDIEFNPERSLNCQARACAIFIALEARQALEACLDSYDTFERLLINHEIDFSRRRNSAALG